MCVDVVRRQYLVRGLVPILFSGLLLMSGCGEKRERSSAVEPAPPPAAQPVPALLPGQLTEYKQQITTPRTSLTMKPGAVITIPVHVTNIGNQGWRNEGELFTDLSYRWLKNGEVMIIEGERTQLGKRLTPGESIDLDAKIKAPPAPGDYELALSMVQEGAAWFLERGATPCRIPVKVR